MDIDFGNKVGKLPYELVQLLNETYFLHLLATEPDAIVEPPAELHKRVENVVHEAFWKQALETLSDPTPSVQIGRLKGLLFDGPPPLLCFVLPHYFHSSRSNIPLFPANHPIIATLSAPLPPTASPLISTNLLLKEILVDLRERAAPVRDATIDALLATLDAPLSPILGASPSSSIKSTTSQLAQLVINTIKSIITLSQTMRADLSQFVLGSMTEPQLRDVVVQQAKEREKDLVLDIWGDSGKDGTDHVQSLWQTWVDELQGEQPSEPRDQWIRRLVQSLGASIAVSCTIPAESVPDRNQLPPQFFFTAPRLLYVQNYLQALVSDSTGHDFMARVWALLKTEIDEETPSASGTKIINFADEVVRTRRLVSVPDESEEAQLHAAVDRTLQYGDPVFLLLQKRLLAALSEQLCRPRVARNVAVAAPERMQTGRMLGAGRADKRPRLEMEPESSSLSAMVPVKGFEDPVLVRGIEEILTKLANIIGWVNGVWFSS
ncbi:hypothetical protein K438DRAFT_1959640 [Mycena galopus ATCC 62051]|nr:hypothetical protein K438DRAFT_1959640 [Mycena galopus ATCC 62051]